MPESQTPSLEHLKPGYRYPAYAADQEYFAASGILGDEQIHALVLFDRRIDTNRLNRAIRLVRDANPVLGCLFNPDNEHPEWVRSTDLDGLNIWTVHVESGMLPAEARPGVYRFVIGARNPAINSPLEARLFRSTTDMLCLKLHHAAADAQGLKEILYQIAAFYQRLEKEPGFYPIYEPLERDVCQVLAYSAVTGQSLAAAAEKKQAAGWVFPANRPTETVRPAYAVHKVPLMIYKSMRAYAGRQHSSVEEILIAAYYRALAEMINPASGAKLQIQTLVDLRPEMPADKRRAIGNFSRWAAASAVWYPEEPFSTILKRIQQVFGAIITKRPWLAELAQMITEDQQTLQQRTEKINQQRQAALKGNAAPALANFGAFELERLNFGETRVLDAYLLGPTQAAPQIQVNASLFGEALTLSANYYEDAVDPAQIEQLLSLIVSHLAEF